MSSPIPDDYAGLMAPWKPISDFSATSIASLHAKFKDGHGFTEGDLLETDTSDSIIGSDADAKHENLEVSGPDDIYPDNLVDDGVEEDSGTKGLKIAEIHNIIDGDNRDGIHINAAEVTDTDHEVSLQIDTKCVAVATCVANSGDHRKVVSHIFGRNKTSTRELPNNLWIFWCRKHYQRFKYRAEDAQNWHTIQLGLVRKQLQTFDDWGEIQSWNISLRKTEQDAIAKENKHGITYTNYISTCWERFLVPYLGANKTFGQVRHVLQIIERKFNEAEYLNRDKKLKTFPGVEFLPVLQKAKEAKKRAAKKGEVTYKKITLDQPKFKSKNRANNQYIKELAAKKRGTSTPERSGRTIKKEPSPNTDNNVYTSTKMPKTFPTDNETNNPADSKHTTTALTSQTRPTKRKSSSPIDVAPPTWPDKALPTKRRRLTRGYEMYGSGSEETPFTEKNEDVDADQG